MPVIGFPDQRSYDRVRDAVRKVGELGAGVTPNRAAPPYAGLLLVKGAADVAKGSSGTFTIYAGPTQGAETDTGVEIDGYCRMADYTANTWAYAQPVGGKYEIAPECLV